jgi:hypothetical protein
MMKTVQKTFAIIEDGVVANAIVGEALVIMQALLPEADLVEVTEANGPAFIDGPYIDGVFLPPKPYDSWTLDLSNKKWKAPVDQPETKAGFFSEWNESTLKWDIKEILVSTNPE